MANGSLAHIGLGSNLGDRRRVILSALADLSTHPAIEVRSVSRLLETDPVGPPDQGRYLNGAAALRTALAPRELLAALQAIETAHGRNRAGEKRWGPRPLDLDLLLYDDLVLDEPGLTVPHPRMHARAFVLEPLAQIAPEAVHPLLGQTVRSLYATLLRRPRPEYAGKSGCSLERLGE